MEEKKKQELRLIKKNSLIVNKLRELNLDFNDIFILECFYHISDKKYFDIYQVPSLKDLYISQSFQKLKKQDFLVEDPSDNTKVMISVKGRDLYNNLQFMEEVELPDLKMTVGRVIMDLSKTPEECFEEWWKAYPTSPAWKTDDGNTIFTGSRTLKNIRKAEAKKRYLKLLNQGLKHEELLGSLLFEINLKKLDSTKKGANQMEYFNGMDSYFNQGRHLLYIDSYRENPEFAMSNQKIKSKKQNVTDI